MDIDLPSRTQIAGMLHALFPPGRAYQRFDLGGVVREKSVFKSFLYAVAGPWLDMETIFAQALYEFSPNSMTEITEDLWMEEYGLPDACDPWGSDVAIKATTLGGTSAAYYEGLLSERGYAADMRWLKGHDAEFPGVHSTLHVVLNSSESGPAYQEIDMANWTLNTSALGEPDLSGAICILDEVIPAHCAVTYEIT